MWQKTINILYYKTCLQRMSDRHVCRKEQCYLWSWILMDPVYLMPRELLIYFFCSSVNHTPHTQPDVLISMHSRHLPSTQEPWPLAWRCKVTCIGDNYDRVLSCNNWNVPKNCFSECFQTCVFMHIISPKRLRLQTHFKFGWPLESWFWSQPPLVASRCAAKIKGAGDCKAGYCGCILPGQIQLLVTNL